MAVALALKSEAETLHADLYGAFPAVRAAVLVHGQSWSASGWADVAPCFADRGVPAIAVDLRGSGGSSGRTEAYVPGQPWSPVADLRSAIAELRQRGAREVALVGASLGGHAVLAAALEEDVECVATVSAPVNATPDQLSARVRGRKLYLGTSNDHFGATEHMISSFKALRGDKRLVLFGGTEHSREMFTAPYGEEAIAILVNFVSDGV